MLVILNVSNGFGKKVKTALCEETTQHRYTKKGITFTISCVFQINYVLAFCDYFTMDHTICVGK